MGVFVCFKRNLKTIFVFTFSLNALFFCVWIFIQKQTPRSEVVTYNQQINKSLANSSPFKLEEVTESDVKLWQGKFYSSLASATKSQSKGFTKWKSQLSLYSYNQRHLSDVNQITLPGNESTQAVNITSQNGLLQFLETASCQPITPGVVFYNRVYKTGSETTGALFDFVAAAMNYIYTRREFVWGSRSVWENLDLANGLYTRPRSRFSHTDLLLG